MRQNTKKNIFQRISIILYYITRVLHRHKTSVLYMVHKNSAKSEEACTHNNINEGDYQE